MGHERQQDFKITQSDIYPKKYEENNELKEKNDFIALIASENVDEIERVIKDVKNNFDATMELSHENAKTGERINFTPLLLATMGGLDITVIEKLIDLGARINQASMQPLGLRFRTPSTRSYISMTPLLYSSLCDKHTKFQKCELAEFFRFFPRKRSLDCIRDGGEFLQKLIGFGADPNQTIEIIVQGFNDRTKTYNNSPSRFQSNILMTTLASNDCFECIQRLIQVGANPYQRGFAYMQREQKVFYGNAIELVAEMVDHFQIRVENPIRTVIYERRFNANLFQFALKEAIITYNKMVKKGQTHRDPRSLQEYCKHSILREIRLNCSGLKLTVDFVDDIEMPDRMRDYLKEWNKIAIQ